ncbi:MAG: DUF5777 family beta-barrel protein, partial [Marinirhabdus sp.]
MKKLIFAFLLLSSCVYGQDDLLNELEAGVTIDPNVSATFKGLKVVNFESTKLANKKALYFIVAHRFGSVKNGVDNFFGLDNAVTQIKFIYGVNDWLNVGVARSSFLKKYGGHVKYRLKNQQTDGFPVTIAGYNLITINTAIEKNQLPKLKFQDRINYVSQLLISKKISENLSLLIAPTYLHENLATRSINVLPDNTTQSFDENNDHFMIGAGGRCKLTARWSVNVDYGLHLNRNDNTNFRNPFSVGVDLETGGHVFQMHFTNAQAMFEDGFIAQASGHWGDG